MTAFDPIPVTLLTGFLGSGKTTLLNGLLRDPGMDRVAVVMNEFGDVALDHDLVETAREAMVLMESGCLCCTVRGDLAQTLDGLRARREAGEIAFDRVVIETTGIADPGPIVQTLVMDGALSDRFVLDGVIVTADAASGPATLDTQFEAVQQIAMADRIVLTKTDLVTPARRTAFEARLAAINPGAARVVADHGRLAPALLFGIAPRAESGADAAADWIGAIAAGRALPPMSGLAPVDAGIDPLGSGQGHGLFAAARSTPRSSPPAPSPPSHDGRITSQSALIETPIPPIVFDLWLEGLISAHARDLLRLKAVVHVEGMPHPFALHGVQHIFHPPQPLTHWPKDDTTSRFVIIGRDLPPGALRDSLAILRSRPETVHHRL